MSDDLRARLTALEAKWSGCWCETQQAPDHDPRVQDCPQHGDDSCQHMAEGITVDLRALLADPAPEAAREATCLAANCDPCAPSCVTWREQHALPADLPIATGVTTEDEGTSWFEVEYERAKQRNAQIPPHARMIVTGTGLDVPRPAPAPVVSAGDEGVGLREIDREMVCIGGACDYLSFGKHSPDCADHAVVVERIIAARVAEAGARAPQ